MGEYTGFIENSRNVLERDKALYESIEIIEDVSFRLILKDLGSNQHYVPLPIC